MKKPVIIVMLLLISSMFSCDYEPDKKEIHPWALFSALGWEYNKYYTIILEYNGAYTADGTMPGTQYRYVFFYESLGSGPASPQPVYMLEYEVSNSCCETVSVSDIKRGYYYIMVLYDYQGSSDPSNLFQENDPYLLYNDTGGTNCPDMATPILLFDEDQITISFDDTYRLDPGSGNGPLFDVCP